MPLVLTQFALRQVAAISETYGQTVRALSRLPELGGYTRAGHAERVTGLCVEMGLNLGLAAREVRALEYAALLHDIGQVGLRAPIPGGATLMAAPADQRHIAMDSAEIVRKTGVSREVVDAIASQTVPYRVVRELGEELPMASRIIKVANAYDDLVGGSINVARRAAAVERIQLGLGYEYDPRVVESLVKVLERRESGTSRVGLPRHTLRS
jgi:HD-GYP domain-containing protein (c-di-GMP phosphodiesterase class II)